MQKAEVGETLCYLRQGRVPTGPWIVLTLPRTAPNVGLAQETWKRLAFSAHVDDTIHPRQRGLLRAPGLLSFGPHLSPSNLHLVILPCEGYSMGSWFPEEALPSCSPKSTTGERRTSNEKRLQRCTHSGPKSPSNWLEDLHGAPNLAEGHSPFPKMGVALLILH